MTRDTNVDSPAAHPRSRWFVLAAVAGGVHTGITLYWAIGGRALLWTMGDAFIAKFASVMWILYPLAAVKAVGAFGPLWFQSHQWQPSRSLIRLVYWCASVVLLIWGGLNTVVSNLVLFGIIRPSAGYDRPVMIGHAWIWDPLFVVWGLGLLLRNCQDLWIAAPTTACQFEMVGVRAQPAAALQRSWRRRIHA